MPARMGRSKRSEGVLPGPGDFHAYLARNLSGAYRLAVLATDSPIAAAAIVRAASIAVWRDATTTRVELDRAFWQRLEADLEEHIGAGGGIETGEPEPLETAVRSLSPRRQIELARAFAPPGPGTAPESAQQTEGPPPLSAADLGLPLRALYEARDPGDTPPLQLRLQLNEDGREAEAVRAARLSRSYRLGWAFAFNSALAIVALTLVLALASVITVRAGVAAGGAPINPPASPLAIGGISLIQGGVEGGPVQVGAAQGSLVAAFPTSTSWPTSTQDCSADIFGVIDATGQPTWVGARAGQAGTITGDPSSQSVYVEGLGPYCQPSSYVSDDGGLTWTAGSYPGDPAGRPSWLAFDPTHPHTLLAYEPGRLYESKDSGLAWTSISSKVTPLAFDWMGRLVGWTAGRLYQSSDDGVSWQQTSAGPNDMPVAAGATPNGILLGAQGGLWWYPLDAAPRLVTGGRVLSIASLGNGAVILGADGAGRPWLGSFDDSQAGISMASLPPDATSLAVTSGEVALNNGGAIVALSGKSSLIAFATFAP
jgi:hypothetical protein